MSARESLLEVVRQLPEHRVQEVLDFAEFIRAREAGSADEWHRFALARFEAGYGPDEPEYTVADLRPETVK